MLTDLLKLHNDTMKFHSHSYVRLGELDQVIKRINDMKELADCVYALREIIALLDDAKSTATRLKDYCERVACVLWVKADNPKPISTAWCSGTPDLKTMASLPKKSTDPDAYYALTRHLGIPDEVAKLDAARVHWPGFVEYLTKLTSEGRPLPPGIDPNQTYPVYSLSVRKRRELTFEQELSFDAITVQPDNVCATCFQVVG